MSFEPFSFFSQMYGFEYTVAPTLSPPNWDRIPESNPYFNVLACDRIR